MNTENNKLLADFLGLKNYTVKENGNILEKGKYTSYNYSKDWNSLMAVVEKIESLDINNFAKQLGREDVKPIEGSFYLSIRNTQAEFLANVYYWQHDNNIKGLKEINANTKIKAVYNACVEFIKWYNQNK